MSGNGVKVTRRKISDYVPDPHNANKGTERGQYMIDASVGEVGLARSIVATADNTIPAGNKTLQAALDAGLEDVIEVETDGRALVVVKRTDWATVDDEQARKYAYYDNRASEVGLDWDTDQLLADIEAGIDLDALFHDWELDQLMQAAAGEVDYAAEWAGMPEFENEDAFGAVHSVKVHFTSDDAIREFAELIGQTVTENTKSIWFPKQVRENLKKYAVDDES